MANTSHIPRPGDSDTDLRDSAELTVDPDLIDDETDASDADDEADDAAPADDTTAKTGSDDDVLAGFDLSGPGSRPKSDLDTDDAIAVAPVFDEPSDGEAVPSTGLTAVGFPSFADPPDVTSPDDKTPLPANKPSEPTSEPPLFPGPPSQSSYDDPPDQFQEIFVPAVEPPTEDASPPVVEVQTEVSPVATSPRATRKDKAATQRPSPHRKRSATSASEDRQRLVLILLASYASAITLAFVWLWLNREAASPYQLENLPDVAPLDANEFRYVPQSATMPPGHTLPLGGSEQFGYVRVEPLGVTRGPVEFTHYDDAALTRAPTDPVLKLRVRFTNVSDDQLIAPLDAALLLTRSYQSETDTILANQLVQPADKQAAATYVLDHPLSSEWDLKDQRLGYRLKPGESLETYIPTDPSSAPLTGDLVWRVHFRKGYNPQTGHGVTTMVEVPFAANQVEDDPPTS